MDDIYIIWFLLFVAVFLPLIARRKRLAAIWHILNKKMRKEEADDMTELAKRFIGKECIIYTVTGSEGNIKGTIKEVDEGGLIVERADGLEAVNLEFVTRIREWPRNSKGKKKQVFD